MAEVYGLMILLLDEFCSKEVCGLPDVVDKQQEDGFEAKKDDRLDWVLMSILSGHYYPL